METIQQEKPQFLIQEVLPGLTKLNALVKNIMRQTGVDDPNKAIRLVNSGEFVVVPKQKCWLEEGGVIYFSVTTNGRTGGEWIAYLKHKEFNVGEYAESVLRSKDFQPMATGTTIGIAVLKGGLFAKDARTTTDIRADAKRRKFGKPSPEVACLIRVKFTDKEIAEMGLWAIVAMHDPIEDSGGGLNLLGARRGGGGCGLSAWVGSPGRRWDRGDGFAFSVELVS
jgi:hypothetical protein